MLFGASSFGMVKGCSGLERWGGWVHTGSRLVFFGMECAFLGLGLGVGRGRAV